MHRHVAAGETFRKRLYFRPPPAVRDRLRRIAQAEGKSIDELVRSIVTDWLADYDESCAQDGRETEVSGE